MARIAHRIPRATYFRGRWSNGDASPASVKQAQPWAFALTERDRQQLAEILCESGGCFVQDQPASAYAYLVAALPELLEKPVVIVLDGPRTMDHYARDCTTLRPDLELAYYPPWESLPGRGVAPLGDLLGDRLKVLRQCLEPQPPRVVLTCVQALMQKTRAPADLAKDQLLLVRGEDYDFESLLKRLQDIGYDFDVEVLTKGQAAHRGGIIDCWPPSETWPVRLEFFGSTLESLRAFDPQDQRSIDRLDELLLMPAIESGLVDDQPAYSATLLEYLSPQTVWVWIDADRIRDHAAQYETVIEEADAHAFALSYATVRAAVKRKFTSSPLYLGGQKPRPAKEWGWPVRPLAGLPALGQLGLDSGAIEEARIDFVEALRQKATDGEQVRLYFGTQGTLDRFLEWWQPRGNARNHFTLIVGPLSEGFHYTDHRLLVVSEQDLYGRQRQSRGRYDPHARRAGPRKVMGQRLSDWRDIQPGEWVVHIEHGIGRYLGLYEVEIGGRRQEALTIEYADAAKIFLPVSQAHLLSRYVGFGRTRPNLHALGGKRWTREKMSVERAVRDLAANLLETQATRQTLSGHAFAPDSPWQHEFEAAFPYQETDDQLTAIQDVKADMESPRPMDRLICGDVGYGKTEVAMRAAFKAVMDGRQVAMLVPTTVLAQQHYETFRERMTAFPIRLEMLSRFRTKAEQRAVVEDLNAGRVDIVIGTHRLVQPDVVFDRLGLVIIDEEQRFGVEHKEHLKALRQLVDVLTMTATPIPRTLYMSLAGARDISTIQTPPQERLPVETIVTEYREEVIRDAIHRELSREGQVFYLHNRVQTIAHMGTQLQKLVPEARIAIAHGQMQERELESVMAAFVRGEYDILLCTTIIESGVDIPNVNTILIERADRFGLSGLYQLRGRVGRYKHKAYAYLLLPRHSQLHSTARERVSAIRKYSGLGSGFKLAMRDLEIRGSGNILGAQQSGHIAAVGFDLYCQFLKRTVAKMKGEEPPPIIDVEMKLDFIDAAPAHAEYEEAAVIPVSYMEDEHLRVNVYRRIAGITDRAEIQSMREELMDRLGPVPPALDRLLKLTRIRLYAHENGIREIEVKDHKVMMKRQGQWIMLDRKFPRLQGESATERLDELTELVQL